jgi:serine/threonine protein kinase
MSAVESLGKYEIRRQLGRGAMGTVYEGFDPVIERIVAIKTVRLPDSVDEELAEEIARFKREAQAAGRLNHPNIVGVFDYGETRDLAYIVMEYVDGPPLKSLLDKNERFPLPRIVQIMQDLLTGLQFSHERGVVHRDIKPANLMLTKAGQAKIADFGIARIESSSMTQAGTVLGTPAYMSPEQFMGQVVDARSDIYSSGVLLYQLLTGERPFEGSMSAIMHKALNTEAPMPSQISVTAPRPFDAVVKKAMAKRPEDRFQSATEFLGAIKAAFAAPAGAVEEEEDSGEATMVSTPRPATISAPRPATISAPRPATTPAQRPATTPTPRPAIPPTPPAQAAGAGTTGRRVDPFDQAPAAPTAPPPRQAAAVAATAAAPKAAKSSALPIALGGGAVGLAVLGGLGYYLLAGRSQPEPISTQPTISTTTPVVPPVQTTTPVSPPVQTTTPVPPPQTPQPTPQPQIANAPLTPLPTTTTTPPVQEPPVTPTPPTTPQVALVQPPPTVTPVPPPRPPIDPNAAPRAELAAFTTRLACSLVDGDIRDGAVQMSGISGRPAVDSLRQKLANMGLSNPSLRVTQVDPVFCGWEDLLRPIAATFGDSGSRLSLRLLGDPAFFRENEFIKPRLTMADFRGDIRVDYLDRDGNVQHMYPQRSDPAHHLAADPPHVFEPGEALSVGDREPGFQVGPPFGTDIIIAIASEKPLFDRPRPTNVEQAAAYLQDLRRALDTARNRGERLAATAISVETRK